MSCGLSPCVYLRCSLNSTEKPWNGTGVQALQKALHDELRAQIEPRDLADDLRLQIFFDGGHRNGRDNRMAEDRQDRNADSTDDFISALHPVNPADPVILSVHATCHPRTSESPASGFPSAAAR